MMRSVGAFDYKMYVDTLIHNATVAALRPKKKHPLRFTKKATGCVTRNYIQVLDSLVKNGYIVEGVLHET